MLDSQCRSRHDQSEDIDPREAHLLPSDYQCNDEIDNDQDGLVDFPEDPGCAALGDLCEQGGFESCLPSNQDPLTDQASCVDLLNDPNHCGSCQNACEIGLQCIQGLCETSTQPPRLRPRLMKCGITIRSLNEFLVGPLAQSNFIISSRCDPDDSVQAMLVSRSGLTGVSLNLTLIQDYLERGGMIISEKNIGPSLYGKLLGIPQERTTQIGSCQANIQPLVQHLPDDPLWSLVPHLPPTNDVSGCGDDLHELPGIVRLGGWDHLTTSLAYRDVGQGRIWLVAADWRDQNPNMTDESRALMAAMISGGGKPQYAPNLPECMDHIDNDKDGYLDLFDPDCESAKDETEWQLSHLPSGLAECADGLDNDQDGFIDFPFDQECEAAGATSESIARLSEGADPNTELLYECTDGVDNDQDELTDWPWDPSCLGRGSHSESTPEPRGECHNRQDDDGDGLIDFPADPDCLATSSPSELPMQRQQPRPRGLILDSGVEANNPKYLELGCQNGADDDGDGLVDYPADLQCLTPLDRDEEGESTTLSLGLRLTGYAYALPECLDGLDNDGDGYIDLADSSCFGPTDLSAEAEDEEILPACADLIDNDEDGEIDWPEDYSCLARGADSEDTCGHLDLPILEPGVETVISPVLTPQDLSNSWTEWQEDWPEIVPSICGQSVHLDQYAPQLLRFTQPEISDLSIHFDEIIPNGEEHFAIAVGLQKQCGSQAQLLLCTEIHLSSSVIEERTLSVPNLPAGDYILTLHAPHLTTWESSAHPIDLPTDPEGYIARDDITSVCWQDGGADGFDCMGRIKVTYQQSETTLNTSLGIHTLSLSESFKLRYASEKAHTNVWRLRFWGVGSEVERQEIGLEFYGNLGHDGLTTLLYGQTDLQGYTLPYWQYTDNVNQPIKPPALTVLIPHHGTELSLLDHSINNDQVSLKLENSRLPVTYYLASSYLPTETLLDLIKQDLRLMDYLPYERRHPEQVTLQVTTFTE